jgi:hypothetical protein
MPTRMKDRTERRRNVIRFRIPSFYRKAAPAISISTALERECIFGVLALEGEQVERDAAALAVQIVPRPQPPAQTHAMRLTAWGRSFTQRSRSGLHRCDRRDYAPVQSDQSALSRVRDYKRHLGNCRSLDGNGFGQVARLIHVAAAADGYVICQQL